VNVTFILERRISGPGEQQKHYDRYTAWCRLLGIPPAPFDTWHRETAKIANFAHAGSAVRTTVRSAASA
jgi:hypothetical protein